MSIPGAEFLHAAIQAHHDTKYGSNPATGPSVISPPDQALYLAAGIVFRAMNPNKLYIGRQISGAEIMRGKEEEAI